MNPPPNEPMKASDIITGMSLLKNSKPLHSIEQQQAKYAAAEKQRNIDVAREHWNLPKRYRTFAAPHVGPWGDNLRELIMKLGTGFTVALTGSPGTGKTQIGAELMKVASGDSKLTRYITAVDFFMDIKATYQKNSGESEKDVVARFREPRLLVIDEMNKRPETEWSSVLLFELINKRYGDMKDTLLIDNRTKDEFDAAIGDSIVSRMQETGGVIVCDWKSFRS